jgi:branched-chain amino acid transport system ATP-binding protein
MTVRPPLLELKLCHVRYGLVPALHGISFKVEEGERVALLGANGAGKTTTLRAISGLVKPTSGQITFMGERIDGLSPPEIVRKGIAQMPEGRDLFPQLGVEENLRFGYLIHKKDRAGYKPQLDEVYTAFPKLKERRRQHAGTLSGGEQQMLTAGIALMSRPKLLLVDELSLGLAPMIVAQLFDVLMAVNAKGTAVVLVEQFVPLALAHTQRAYVLSKGEVVISKNSEDLEDDPELVASYLGGAGAVLEEDGEAAAHPRTAATAAQIAGGAVRLPDPASSHGGQ